MPVLIEGGTEVGPAVLELEGAGQAQGAQAAARRTLRVQIARLEAGLADAVCEAFPEPIEIEALPSGPARVLDVGELERSRDHLARQLGVARRQVAELALGQERARLRLERMLLDPAAHRGERISQRELGEPGCGVWSVAPRLGIIGRMMGWWQVKLSSGCPLAT